MIDPVVNHARRIYSLVESGADRRLQEPEARIARSWRRCIEEYGLDPARAREPQVVDRAMLLERQERLEQMLAIAKVEMTNLYQQIAGSGYAVLLTDRDGVVLNYIADPSVADLAVKSGLVPGAFWDEKHQGTNGMGTCLADRKPIVVYHEDHFFARNTILTCAAAPIFDPFGTLQAVLDASSNSRDSRQGQQHTMVLVSMAAQMVENCGFLAHFKEDYLLRFHSRPEFVSILGEGILAFNEEGHVLAANQSALNQLGYKTREELAGAHIGEIFDLTPSGLAARAMRQPNLVLPIHDARHGRRFFAMVHLPARRRPAGNPVMAKNQPAAPAANRPFRATLEELDYGDPRMAYNIRCALRVMNADIPVLLYGETGTGKEVFARAIHMASDRAHRPFVAVNCAAIPESLIESELFGYRYGAFTGARREGSRGKILQADGGTLFLDEIGDMPLQLQTRLLRILEEREVVPLGGETAVPVDLHVISATHRNLQQLVTEGRFREDLYYRLRGIELTLPPLRERTDIAALIRAVLAQESGASGPVELAEDAFAALLRYAWPGNLRQLRSVLRTMVVLRTGDTLRLADLPPEIAAASLTAASCPTAPGGGRASGTLALAEREALLRELERHRWNVSSTSASIGLSRNTLYRKMKKHGIFQAKGMTSFQPQATRINSK